MTVPHPIVERFNAEIAADILANLIPPYGRRIATLMQTERGRNCPLEARTAVKIQAALAMHLQEGKWTYSLLQKWLVAWREAAQIVDRWFVGLLDNQQTTDALNRVSTNVDDLIAGRKTSIDFEVFALLDEEKG